jgi:hypothetical protein
MADEFILPKSKIKILHRLFIKGYEETEEGYKARDEYDKKFYEYLKNIQDNKLFDFSKIIYEPNNKCHDKVLLTRVAIYQMCFDSEVDNIELISI